MAVTIDDHGRQIDLNLPPPDNPRADDFIITDSNRFAARFIASWPGWPTATAILTGPAHSGKSHLAELWARHSGAVSFNAATQQPSTDRLTPLLDHHALIIDAADWLLADPDEHGDRVLFRLINAAEQHHFGLLLLSRSAPSTWRAQSPDLISRLGSLPHLRLLPPCDDLLQQLIIRRFNTHGIVAPATIITYLARRIERSHQSVCHAVDRIHRAAHSSGQKITRGFVARVLDDTQSPA